RPTTPSPTRTPSTLCCAVAPRTRATPRAPMGFSVALLAAPATPEPSTLSLHDALPIFGDRIHHRGEGSRRASLADALDAERVGRDRKSTRLNSSHSQISYAVFCLKKKTSQWRLRVRAHSR